MGYLLLVIREKGYSVRVQCDTFQRVKISSISKTCDETMELRVSLLGWNMVLFFA
jgi:hypothetical protein